jgi:hypothetical protein
LSDDDLFELRAWAACVLPGDDLYPTASRVLELVVERNTLRDALLDCEADAALIVADIDALLPRTDPCPPPPTE